MKPILLIAIVVTLAGCQHVPPPAPPSDDPESGPPLPGGQSGEPLPANPSKIAIELGSGSVVIDNVRTTSHERTVIITRNPQDILVVTEIPFMQSGLEVDTSDLAPFFVGYDSHRVRDTDEEPQGPGAGSFRTVCDIAWMKNDDPVVHPGKPGKSHTHTGVANTVVDAFSTAGSLLAGGNSTCRGGTINRSAYWFPTMIDTRTSKPLYPPSINVYYKNFGMDRHQINEFPEGLRMVTGDPQATKPQPNNSGTAGTWKCGATFYTGIPTDQVACPPGSSLIHAIYFPQCWDGVNLDSPDHKSHMAFSGNAKVPGTDPPVYKKQCPASHPKAIAQLSFQINWTVTDSRYMRLVSDTNPAQQAGWTSHGDVISAWNRKHMLMWVNNCLRAGAECFSHLLGRDPDDGKLKAIY